MISYPSWWKGFRWDVEEVQNDLFTFPSNVAAVGLSGVLVLPFATDDATVSNWIDADNGILFVHRSGGRIDTEANPAVDHAMLLIAAMTKSRRASNVLMEYVATIYDGYEHGGTVHRSTPHRSGLATTFMAVPGEVVAPQLDPGLFRDERMTPAMWQIDVRIPQGLPDYKSILGVDN